MAVNLLAMKMVNVNTWVNKMSCVKTAVESLTDNKRVQANRGTQFLTWLCLLGFPSAWLPASDISARSTGVTLRLSVEYIFFACNSNETRCYLPALLVKSLLALITQVQLPAGVDTLTQPTLLSGLVKWVPSSNTVDDCCWCLAP